MEHFLRARGYRLLCPEEVLLDYKAIQDTVVKSHKNPQRWDFDLTLSDLPHALTCVVNGNIFVHVVEERDGSQAFFLIASRTSGILGKPPLKILLDKCLRLAHTIIVLNEISQQVSSLTILPADPEKNLCRGELILKQHILFAKLTSKSVVRYQILNDEERKEVLAKYYTSAAKIPWMYETDAMARYFGLERDMIVRVLEKDIQYRLVIS